MSVQETISNKISAGLDPIHLDVINETPMHNVPADSESHFKVIVVSKKFEGQSLVQRHRQVNAILSEELKQQIHALSLHTMSPEEWESKKATPSSPECLGGSKAD